MVNFGVPHPDNRRYASRKEHVMNLVDIVVVLIVLVLFVLCVRSLISSTKKGECADCVSGGSCNASHGGKCKESAKLMADASAAVKRYQAEKGATK